MSGVHPPYARHHEREELMDDPLEADHSELGEKVRELEEEVERLKSTLRCAREILNGHARSHSRELRSATRQVASMITEALDDTDSDE